MKMAAKQHEQEDEETVEQQHHETSRDGPEQYTADMVAEQATTHGDIGSEPALADGAAVVRIERKLDALKQWFELNRLQLND